MAAWSSKRRAFEYSCNFSTDEAIMAAYAFPVPPEVIAANLFNDLPNLVAEVRTNFYIKAKGEKRWLGSEKFGAISCAVDRLREELAPRLRDYCLSPRQIKGLLDAARLSEGPTVLDLEIRSRSCLAEEEAMRPETLRPLDLTPPLVRRRPREDSAWVPCYEGGAIGGAEELEEIMREAVAYRMFTLSLVRMYEEEGVRVDDEEKGAAMMRECGMCRRRPFVGSVITKLGCGHLFHYHCVVWHLKDHRACPTCTAPLPPPIPAKVACYL